jgi:pilus assembly protein CpaE
MSQKVDAELLMEVIHLGAKEFIPLPMRPERLLTSIERIAHATSGSQQQAKIIQFIPTVGGCGATSVACNVAAMLARGAKTVLIDLDLVCGAVATNFNLNPRYTIADVMISGGTLDRNLVENALAVDPGTGLHVLARPEHQEDSQRVTRMGLTRLLGVLSRQFEYIVIDSRMSVDPVYLAATQAADTSVLVMELNVPAARNAERYIATLKRLGTDTHKVKVIVNRFEKRGSDIKPNDLEKTLGLKVAWMIPNDFRNAIGAINFGQPVVVRAPRAEISGSIAGLANLLNGKSAKA